MAQQKMKHLKLSDIVVEGRFREDLGNLDELIESIREKGIIQPISVSSDMRLLAGGRRFAACQALELPTIPALIRENVDELDSKEVELFENIHRKDFSWQERVKLTAAIDALYKARDPEWSGRKTAGLLDRSVGSVAGDLELAKVIEVFPEMAEHKTADDARKAFKKFEENVLVAELAKRQKEKIEAVVPAGKFDPEANIKALLRRADESYHIGDIFDGLSKMRTNGHVHFIECDPPYGIDLNSQKGSKDSVGNNVDSYKEVARDAYPEFLGKLTKELYRVANKDCWMIFWFGPTWFHEVKTALRDAGWAVDDIPGIWTKASGQTLQPQVNLARMYEPFFVCRKGQPVLAKPGTGNVFFCAQSSRLKYHPTERPVFLIRDLLETFCLPNNVVFVPFLGSGATLRACYMLGMSGYGYDLNDEYKPKYLLHVEQDVREVAMHDSRKPKGADGSEESTDDIPF